MQKNSKTRFLVQCALALAMAFVLSKIKLFAMPQGGDVTACSMLLLALCGYWFGIKWGAVAGFAYAILSMVLGGQIYYPMQAVLDYPLAFGLLAALPALFSKMKFGLQIGYTVGVLGRFICSFLSGFIFFAEYAPAGQSPILYSLIYNASYIVPEMVITLIIISVPAVKRMLDRLSFQANFQA